MSMIDTGLVVVLEPEDRKNFIDLFSSIVKNNGKHAGNLMISRSKDGGNSCTDPIAFSLAIEDLVNKVHGFGLRLGGLGLGDVLRQCLSLCYEYNVKLESRFVSVIIALCVCEGLGRRLDPDVDILKRAAPFILRAVVNKALPK
jgi:aarF domain-containing kinase